MDEEARGSAMTFTMKMTLFLYAVVLGVVAVGLNGHFPNFL
jgi:hypothetical protein